MHHPSHHTKLDHTNNASWWRIQIMKLFAEQFSLASKSLSLLDPNILLSTLFSDILNLMFFPYLEHKQNYTLCMENITWHHHTAIVCSSLYSSKCSYVLRHPVFINEMIICSRDNEAVEKEQTMVSTTLTFQQALERVFSVMPMSVIVQCWHHSIKKNKHD
jgi:hypothetical protein